MELFFLPLALAILATPLIAAWALVRSFSLDRRLRELERERFSIAAAAWTPVPSAAAPPPGPEPSAAAPPSALEPSAAAPPRAPAPKPSAAIEPRPVPVPPPAAARRPQPPTAGGSADLEFRIGVRWFNVAGIVTLLFGVAFFLKWAYENSWIGPRGRVAIGIASGLVALVLGDRTRRRGHRVVSEGLTGGGIAALYLSFFFSFRLYQLIEVPPAFGLMAAVTAG